MKKLFFTILLVCAYGLSVYAYYENNYPITVTQPDGTIVHCFATGDEFYNWVHDENGFTLIRDPQTGIVVYAKLENDELVSTGYQVGSIDPATIGLQPWLNITAEKRMQIRTDFFKNTPEKPVREGYTPPRSGWNNGTLNNLVIYIRFSDQTEFPEKGTIYKDMHNKDQEGYPSQYGYFKALSNEKTLIPSTFYPVSEGSVIISYQDIYPRSYFMPYNATTNPDGYQGGDNGSQRVEREHQLLKRAVDAVANEIPPDLDLDFNNDGLVDNICFIVRGAPTAWATLLWPHRWALYTSSAATYIHGKRVWDFNMQIETHLDGSSASVLAHEMNHTLGAPDLYRYSDNTIDPVGSWDLMCGNSNPPQSTTAYMKMKYGGWIDDIPEITKTESYTLKNVWSETNNAYKIKSPNSSTEYFIIEYRDKNVYWDSGLKGSGMLIYRINTLAQGNAGGPPDEVYIFRPGGTNTTTNGNINSANFSENAGRTEFHNFSNPPCFLSNNQPGGIFISNIGQAGGETMSFYVNFSMANSELTLSTEELVFSKIPVGTTSDPQTITVSGSNLLHPIQYTKSGSGNEFFNIEEIDWDPSTGGTLNITFSPESTKIFTPKIVFSSLGAASKTVLLKGQGSGVAIDDISASSSILVYPNPTTGELKIENGKCKIENVEVFDIMGRTAPLSPPKGGKQFLSNNLEGWQPKADGVVLNISHLPTGVYFIRILTNNNVIAKKIIKY